MNSTSSGVERKNQILCLGFAWWSSSWSSSQESTHQLRRQGFDPWPGKILLASGKSRPQNTTEAQAPQAPHSHTRSHCHKKHRNQGESSSSNKDHTLKIKLKKLVITEKFLWFENASPHAASGFLPPPQPRKLHTPSHCGWSPSSPWRLEANTRRGRLRRSESQAPTREGDDRQACAQGVRHQLNPVLQDSHDTTAPTGNPRWCLAWQAGASLHQQDG